MKTIPHNLIENKTYCVNYLVFLNDKGAREHLYIAVRRDEMPEFKQVVLRGNFDPEEYGVVLEYGRGDALPEIKEKMKMLYNCDHEKAVSVQDYNPEHG